MLHQNRSFKNEGTSNQKGSLEFLITTLVISLLTILGIFISHYNKNMLFTGNIGISISVISNDSIGKGVDIVSTKKFDATFMENIVSDVDIKETLSNTEKSKILVASHPYFGQDQRSIESWKSTNVREGVSLKFGRGLTMSAPEKVVD